MSEIDKVKRIVLSGVIVLLASGAAMAKDEIACSGTLIDIDIDAHMPFPYAAVFDAENYRTCMLDRGSAGHDPLRGVCNPNERCSISGPYRRRVRDTYYFFYGDRGVRVEAPEGSPLRREVPSGK